MKEQLTVSFNTPFLKESAIGLAKIHKASATSNNLKRIKPILEDSKEILIKYHPTSRKGAVKGSL
ncbi:MAG: hypothetical protein R6V72_08725 [Cyclobacterium sp.]|uniref:hypothetical protein n=1 Tax=unclassified Cyclobacterium TaxID=2615055 RepID=UPI0013D36608|nr:hypothetical protein [Cyclobacterium sp. SYSU L10401]